MWFVMFKYVRSITSKSMTGLDKFESPPCHKGSYLTITCEFVHPENHGPIIVLLTSTSTTKNPRPARPLHGPVFGARLSAVRLNGNMMCDTPWIPGNKNPWPARVGQARGDERLHGLLTGGDFL